jgi:hypothetical protein
MGKGVSSITRIKIKTYVKQNWGAPFIFVFMLSLVIATTLLATGMLILAEVAGDFAYFSLVAGVILQCACFLRSEKKQGAEKNGSK